ncbi:hypothetical protein N7462_010556 [Penicillium macrosclerotiorum]|uniref:uncharacterized protein n=1 Tax=Penicillium macrosclerotiorum TaxID=303699 RepID=UPI0025483C66|nr:uncharacterized protein N7462_010556 [Penicillium macrosclerotiorum]KAJ5669486.1 hypothetical protein N7462_010556 [Penicillium macrosclerotiorum]
MPNHLSTKEDSSVYSDSTTSSFFTAYQSDQILHRPLRRQRTVTQLTRWVSKRISRSSVSTREGDVLSEKNLNKLNNAIRADGKEETDVTEHTSSCDTTLVERRKSTIEASEEKPENPIQSSDPDQETQLCLRQSYAAFCEDFTLSGPSCPKRIYDMTMGMEEGAGWEEKGNIEEGENERSTTFNTEKKENCQYGPSQSSMSKSYLKLGRGEALIKSSSLAPDPTGKQNAGFTTHDTKEPDVQQSEIVNRSANHPRPPSQIMTPSTYKEMHRAARERKIARREKSWGIFYSILSKRSKLV